VEEVFKGIVEKTCQKIKETISKRANGGENPNNGKMKMEEEA
jgi:hypothetical protein